MCASGHHLGDSASCGASLLGAFYSASHPSWGLCIVHRILLGASVACIARAERLGALSRAWARLVGGEPMGTCSPEGKGSGLRLRLGY